MAGHPHVVFADDRSGWRVRLILNLAAAAALPVHFFVSCDFSGALAWFGLICATIAGTWGAVFTPDPRRVCWASALLWLLLVLATVMVTH